MNCVQRVITGVSNTLVETLILLLDLSGSMNERDWRPSRLGGAKQASIALIEEKARARPQDEVGIVSFANGARNEQAPVAVGSGIDILRKAIKSLRTYGFTDIGAGLKECERILTGKGSTWQEIGEKGFWGWLMSPQSIHQHSITENHARRILLLSDGGHNQGTQPAPVARRLKASGVEIDVIGIGGTTKEVDEDLLKEIASTDEAGSPRYWYIGEQVQLLKKFVSLANRIRCISS